MTARTKPVAVDAAGVIDLDARRAARLETTGPKSVRFGGKVWQFKSEMPMQVVSDFTAGNVEAAFGRLLVDGGEAAAFLAAADLTQTDFAELMKAVYGLELPNS